MDIINPQASDLQQEFEPHVAQVRAYDEQNRYACKGEIVLAGSSLMEQFPINEYLMNVGLPYKVYNRGIGGIRSRFLLENMGPLIVDLAPRKLFINIGSNDVQSAEGWLEQLARHYRQIVEQVQRAVAGCDIIMMAYYPVADPRSLPHWPLDKVAREKWAVDQANDVLRELAEHLGCTWVDVNDLLVNEEGYLRPELAADQIHLMPAAYHLIFERLLPLIH